MMNVDTELDDLYIAIDEIDAMRTDLAESLPHLKSRRVDVDHDSQEDRLNSFVSQRDFSFLDAFSALFYASDEKSSELLPERAMNNIILSALNPSLYSGLPDRLDEDIELKQLIRDDEMLSLARRNGISSLNDYLSLSISSKRFLMIREDVESYRYLASLQYERAETPKMMFSKAPMDLASLRQKKLKTPEDIISILITEEGVERALKRIKIKPKYLEVIEKRGLIFPEDRKTLDEIGKEYQVTRERVRQIEKATKSRINLKFASQQLENHLLTFCFDITLRGDLNFIDLHDLERTIGNEDYFTLLALGAMREDCRLRISYDYGIMYDSELTTIDTLIEEAKDELGVIVNPERRDLNSFEMNVLKKFYNLKDGVYHIRGFSSIDVLTLAMERYFPDGYHINQLKENEDFKKLKEKMSEEYGISSFKWSPRNVSALLERNPDCLLINKGTYQLRKRCATLPDDLIKRMQEYILANPPSIYYITLYTHFREELEALGIDNYFYLKGLIDRDLPTGCKSKRNYISVGGSKTTAVSNTINYMRSFPSIFSLSDLERAFPGVKTYTFMQYAYQERTRGLVFLPRYNFIYLEKIGIDQKTIDDYHDFLIGLFTEFKVKLLTSQKVYDLLLRRRPYIISGLKIASDSYILFSISEQLFQGELFFRRPYISLEDNADADHLLEFIYSLKRFDKDDILEYSKATGIKVLNYLQLASKCYDDYVQVDKFSFVRKDVFSISDEDLDECRKFLEDKLSKDNELYISNLVYESHLPSFSFDFNPYLIAGIARTLLVDEFQVITIGNEYLTADYLIRRRVDTADRAQNN